MQVVYSRSKVILILHAWISIYNKKRLRISIFLDDFLEKNPEYYKPKQNKTGLRPATLLKKRLWHRCFPVSFANISRTERLLLFLWKKKSLLVCKTPTWSHFMIHFPHQNYLWVSTPLNKCFKKKHQVNATNGF